MPVLLTPGPASGSQTRWRGRPFESPSCVAGAIAGRRPGPWRELHSRWRRHDDANRRMSRDSSVAAEGAVRVSRSSRQNSEGAGRPPSGPKRFSLPLPNPPPPSPLPLHTLGEGRTAVVVKIDLTGEAVSQRNVYPPKNPTVRRFAAGQARMPFTTVPLTSVRR